MRTIVWDIDDVLNDLMRSWFEKSWLPSHPDCRLRYADLTENPPHGLLGIEPAEYLASLDRFRLSAEADRMTPDRGVMEWFVRYGVRFRHVALTARPAPTVSPAIQWTLRHFGTWFQTFAFVPSERPGVIFNGPERTKGAYLAWLEKADYFIDDGPANISGAAGLGISTFLVSRPWNRGGSEMPEILEQILQETETAGQEGVRR